MNRTLCIAFILLAGCLTTSKTYQVAAFHRIPHLASAIATYLKNDTTTEAATLATRQAQLSALNTAAQTQSNISASTLSSAWAVVEPWYEAYVTADPKLSAIEKQIRLSNATRLDKLDADELKRQAAAAE